MRALEIFDQVPRGCVLHLQDDGAHEPHVQVGEWAVVDPRDVDVVAGELYLIGWPRCPRQSRTIMQVMFRENGDQTTVSFLPLNRPPSMADLQQWVRDGGRLYAGESGLGVDYLPRYIRGRVIGIFKAIEQLPRTPQLTHRD